MAKIKVQEITAVKDINSKKYPGKTFKVYVFTTETGEQMDTMNKIEAGKEYEGEVTSDQYGVHLRIEKKTREIEILEEILETNKKICKILYILYKSKENTTKVDVEEEVSSEWLKENFPNEE